jgi:biopolymer transport protein ExbD
MKAELTLPDRPAIVHLLAVLDVLVLLLVFFVLITHVAREAGVSAVRMSPSEYRLPDDGATVVVTAQGGASPILHVGLERVQMKDFSEVLKRTAEQTKAETVLLMSDELLPVGIERQISEVGLKLGLNVMLVGSRRNDLPVEEEPADPFAPPPLPDEAGKS